MSCTNCFNGCTETNSDQCIKYTGLDVPALGISNGDSLLSVEQAIISFLVPVLNGTGVKPIIEDSYICTAVRQYLPACTECTGFTLNEVLTAIIRATCDIQTQVTANTNAIVALNADYTIGCLTGVTASSDTHDIVQAVIDQLCALDAAFTTLISVTLPSTYVPIVSTPGNPGVNYYIQSYLTSQNFLALAKDRMIPYAAIPYFGPLSGFPSSTDSLSLTGQGSGYWEKVYLCNGLNGTPDLRGRTLVGVVTGMGGGTLDVEVDPNANPANPNYTISSSTGLPVTEYGANFVTLNVGQMPNHTHVINTVVDFNDPGHFHNVRGGASGSLFPSMNDGEGVTGDTTTNTTGITIDVTATAENTGGGNSHNNVQPSRASFYIMYIP